jgi:hypothetical protein
MLYRSNYLYRLIINNRCVEELTNRWEVHSETDRFFAASGVQLARSTSGQFYYRWRSPPSLRRRLEIFSLNPKAAALRITLNIDGTPLVSRSHTHPSHSPPSRLLIVSIFGCSRPPRNPVYVRGVDPSVLVFSLSSHRHAYISLLFSSHFID